MTAPARTPRFGRWLWLAGVLYAALVAAVVWSLFAARHWALTDLSTPQSEAAWETWREDVRAQQSQPVPVQRRVPKSAEPPALVLMRDYFGVSLVSALVFCSLLFWIITWLVAGILRTAPPAIDST